MSITPSKQTSVYRQVDAIMKTEDIYGGDKYPRLYTVLFYINVRISLILSDLTFNFAICHEI